jgi:arylsulfatase A-like enzyme
MTIVNGVSRIGYMTGGRSALWVDEDIADVITGKAVNFIKENRDNPFFLYFATHDIHVPRMPNQRFEGKSGMGPRGDAILEFDWSVGEVMRTVEELGLSENTIIIVTSDNGPVVDDGYRDQAVELLGSHKPAGPLRGGKYSAFDGGTRVVFITSWTGKIKAGESDALFSQVDLMASFAELTGQTLADGDAPDSFSHLDAILGKSDAAREWLVEQQSRNRLALIRDDWKYIEPGRGPRIQVNTNTETGNDTVPQLYNLRTDLGERNNVALENTPVVSELAEMLRNVREGTLVVN